MNTVMNRRVTEELGFLTSWATVSFSRRTLLRGVSTWSTEGLLAACSYYS